MNTTRDLCYIIALSHSLFKENFLTRKFIFELTYKCKKSNISGQHYNLVTV